jgi:2-polyprenyl-3-methyl-5-hydroxy-6-metoxy-1,4-benzoquinol methylase
MNRSSDLHEQQIIHSWHANAEPWTRAVQTASIASRRLVTDRAIIDAVSSVGPRRVFDIGCGEGWLSRALGALGMKVFGVDVVPALVAEAGRSGLGEFQVQDYGGIANRQLRCGLFDAAVCNFSLLGKESVESLVAALGSYLDRPGYLIIQTMHPVAACGDNAYRDGWRGGSWLGLGTEFGDPAPWYFRTLESWLGVLRRSGFELLECREPTAPDAFAPASVIFICKPCSTEQTGHMEPQR